MSPSRGKPLPEACRCVEMMAIKYHTRLNTFCWSCCWQWCNTCIEYTYNAFILFIFLVQWHFDESIMTIFPNIEHPTFVCRYKLHMLHISSTNKPNYEIQLQIRYKKHCSMWWVNIKYLPMSWKTKSLKVVCWNYHAMHIVEVMNCTQLSLYNPHPPTHISQWKQLHATLCESHNM